MNVPSNDTLWGWVMGLAVGAVSWIVAMARLRQQVADHLKECGEYREKQLHQFEEMEKRQNAQHAANIQRLERIESLLMERPRGH